MISDKYLPGQHERAKLMRYDTAVILKRFFFVEQSLIVTQAGWLAAIEPLDVKTLLPQLMWQDAKTADDMRTRVFELRYPSRLMEIGEEGPLLRLVDEARNAPSALAMFQSLLRVFKPALLKAYREYLDLADEIGDGPSIRFMALAADEKAEQIKTLEKLLPLMQAADPDGQAAADAWCDELQRRLDALGGIGLDPAEDKAGDPVELPNRKPFELAQVPARDRRFRIVRYYWPDVIDPTFPYGDGLRLQLRSAISHLNEVWAVETGGALLHAFADDLGWEFIMDAARWTYDEARHCRMGYLRLTDWGYKPEELPLGSYIYDSAYGQDPIYRLGMLFFFETKNIKRKPERIKSFTEYADDVSRHDMDFDWADETIHASYGNRWLSELLKLRGEQNPDPHKIRERCGELVDAMVAQATDDDRREIRAIAEAIIAKAEQIAESAMKN
ncbi:MAG: DUF455 family protein [Aggregatilineales bacterium]